MSLTVQRRFRIADVFRRLRRCGHERDAIGRVELVPSSLRHDGDHAGFQIEYFIALDRTQLQCDAAFKNLNDFVACLVAFPLGGSGKSGRENTAVPIIREPGEVARGVRMPGAAFEEGRFLCQRGFQRDKELAEIDRGKASRLGSFAVRRQKDAVDSPGFRVPIVYYPGVVCSLTF